MNATSSERNWEKVRHGKGTQSMNETTVVTVNDEMLPITAILAPPGNFGDYMQRLFETAKANVAEIERRILVTERTDNAESIEEAERGLRAAQQVPGQEGHDQQVQWRYELNSRQRRKKIRLTKLTRSLRGARSFVEALRAGYVPLPTMPAVRMNFINRVMPVDVLNALTEAKEAGMFEEFRVIDGRDTNRTGSPVGTRSPAKRDPILVGMIADEMFAIAWWR